MQSQDSIGNTLRKFYSTYGLSQEGPPKDLNISQIIHGNVSQSDFDTLEQICSNVTFYREFKACRDLIEDVATKSSESSQLAEELDQVISRLKFDDQHLMNGIIWYSLAAQLDPWGNRNLELDIVPQEINPIFGHMLQVQGALIFRLYISLVYMKEGVIQVILQEGNSSKMPLLISYRKLLNCDFVRHLRNSLSHADFEPNIAGIVYRDGADLYGATPGFLDWLCTSIFTLHHVCLLVMEKHMDKE